MSEPEPSAPVEPRTGALPVTLLGATLFGLWLLWSGHYTVLLTSIGFLSAIAVTFLCHQMGILDIESIPLHLTHRAATYVPWLAGQTILSNFGVIRRILLPRASDVPATVVVRPSQRTDLGRVTYANSITLTPGTVTVGIDDQKLIVHSLFPDAADGLESGVMDRRVVKFEGSQA